MADPSSSRPPWGDWNAMGTAWSIITTLLSGPLAWGLIGYGVDRLVGTEKVFLPVGLFLGVALAIWLVYWRYGRDESPKP